MFDVKNQDTANQNYSEMMLLQLGSYVRNKTIITKVTNRAPDAEMEGGTEARMCSGKVMGTPKLKRKWPHTPATSFTE